MCSINHNLLMRKEFIRESNVISLNPSNNSSDENQVNFNNIAQKLFCRTLIFFLELQ